MGLTLRKRLGLETGAEMLHEIENRGLGREGKALTPHGRGGPVVSQKVNTWSDSTPFRLLKKYWAD